jgi:hypothetical protein
VPQSEHQAAQTSPPQNASVTWLAERAGVADEAKALAATCADGGAFVQSLVAKGKPAEALQVIAAALPPREGVWWAWVSARHASQAATPGATPPPAIAEALAAVEQWISQPDDERRRAAWAAGERAGLDTAAGCAAAAVFFTSGSVAPKDVTLVPPPAGIDRMLAGNAVALAAATDPSHFEALAGAYIAQGLEVVKQLGGWDKAVAISREHFQAQQDRQQRSATPPPSDSPAGQRPAR